jgi:NAD(P)-dependent dehydrogenase (short-subunit alcohol dehydrogenase family)
VSRTAAQDPTAADDRSVLVVGASSGIGLATALRLAATGARLTLMARSASALAAAENACRNAGSTHVTTVAGTITQAADVRAAVDAALAAHDRIDAVVLTATVMSYGSVESTPADVFTAVTDTAVHGTLHVVQAVMPVLRGQGAGTLIVVNSLLGSVTVPQMGAYATAKWGQRALVRTLQQEIRGLRGVHVCLVSPGSTNTPIYDQAANFTGREARPPVPVQQPDRTAEVIVGLLDAPRTHVSIPVGPVNPFVISGFRLLPWVYDRLVGPLFTVAALTRRATSARTGNVTSPVAGRERVQGRWPPPELQDQARRTQG